MAFPEDVKRVFHREEGRSGASEICLIDSSLVVISGHKGLLSLSEGEIVVRLKAGRIAVTGQGLAARRVSPTEIYLEGRVDTLSFLSEDRS